MIDISVEFAAFFLTMRVVAFVLLTSVFIRQIYLLKNTTIPKYVNNTRILLTIIVGILALAQLVPIAMDIFDILRDDISLKAIIVYRFVNSVSAVLTGAGLYCLYKNR